VRLRLAIGTWEAKTDEAEVRATYVWDAKKNSIRCHITIWAPAPFLDFNRVARRFAEGLAQLADVSIDASIYDKVRAFRAPNSRHPKTELHKRRLSLDELMNLSLDGIRSLAESPEPFTLPAPAAACEQAAADWEAAMTAICQQAEPSTSAAGCNDSPHTPTRRRGRTPANCNPHWPRCGSARRRPATLKGMKANDRKRLPRSAHHPCRRRTAADGPAPRTTA
jgi:hypothetical protein